ncbi:tyrosine-type recombinase/integrase, partial [Paenibacillus sp. FSL R5-808]|uniref:tyrosine-type recombinase/integrase n=2 Tax=Bacillota TaxID=1239 RepID=UPI0003E2BCD4
MPCEPIRDIAKIQEMKEVLQQGQNGFRNRLFFEFLLATALRVSDAVKLRKCDIDNGFVRLKINKTGDFRLIRLNPKVLQMLTIYLETKNADELIFDFGRIMAWHIIKGAAEKCGIQNISTHSTRK